MFGIKIMRERRYLSEKKTEMELVEINAKLTKKNSQLELDIKDLREQNTKLRAINAKRSDEIEFKNEKIRKLTETIDGHQTFRRDIKNAFPGLDFRKYRPVPCNHKCTECSVETENCKKYTGLSVCMMEKGPSFPDSKQ